MKRTRRAGNSLAHNTSTRFVKITYRYHPLAGQRFRCTRVLEGPPRTFVIQTATRRVSVPEWMTQDPGPKALSAPQLGVEYLLALASLLEGYHLSWSTLPGKDSSQEEDHDQASSDSATPRRAWAGRNPHVVPKTALWRTVNGIS